MKEIFEKYSDCEIKRDGKVFNLAGYNDNHFIVARRTKKSFCRTEINPSFLLEKYNVIGVRYEYCSENELLISNKVEI